METSKRVAITFLALTLTLVAIAVYGALHDKLMTDLFAFITELVKVDGVVFGFYFWKSKNENRAKYAQAFVEKFAKEYGIDAAIRIAETVLKD